MPNYARYVPSVDTLYAIAADSLIARYGEPWRAYHTWEHIEENFDLIGDYARAALPGAYARTLLELGNVYHDAIWRPNRPDPENVLGSVVMAERRFGERVGILVAYTNHGGVLPNEGGVLPSEADHLGSVLHDVDLASLGAPPVKFLDNERKIIAEYEPYYPLPRFAQARLDFLRNMLVREQQRQLFHTHYFQERFTAQARVNLEDGIGRWMAKVIR